VKRLALVVVAGLVLAGCGGSSNNDAQAQIKSAYQQFFSGKSSVADRVAVLQNGPKFKSVVQSFASNPLAKDVKVTVSSVALQGSDKANVVYTVSIGSAALPKQNGTAVLQSGKWRVGYPSLCKLVALQGPAPPACAP
jgi:PBP1b-binding outer membrane lipoprotein LpoB